MIKSFAVIAHNKKFNIIFNILTIFTVIFFIVSNHLDFLDDHPFYLYVEFLLLLFFIAEYIIRIFGSINPKKAIFDPIMIVDIISIISFLLPLNLTHLRFIRIIKLFSIFRSRRYKNAVMTITRVFKDEKEPIIVVSVVFCVLICFSSNLMCLAEGSLQKEFSSIIKSMWWAVTASTTVGYGDLVPITPLGKIIASITSMLGIVLYSMMTAVLSSGFAKKLKKISKKMNK